MLSKSFLLSTGLILCMIVSVVRYFTGPEWALSLFYLLPILINTWYIGAWAGILISIVSSISWLIADLMMLKEFSNILIPYLNETFRLVVFLIITITLSKLKNAMERQRLLAMTDPLTGIANRRAFFKLANTELVRANRLKHPLSVLYIDIDNFKTINDQFGHASGDALLCTVAETIKDNTRSIDILARLGGDEFIILLPGTDPEAAFAVARKLQTKLLNAKKNNTLNLTCSFGLITFNSIPHSVDEMVNSADILMYSAKREGKNMIKSKLFNDQLY